MGFLSHFKRETPEPAGLLRLPSGSFTIDASGKVVVSTLPRAFPESLLRQISDFVLQTFRTAREVQMPLSEIVADYTGLKLTARELRGGAIIFLAPRSIEKR